MVIGDINGWLMEKQPGIALALIALLIKAAARRFPLKDISVD